ncbi:hypothetical protein Lesp02_54730 [Lentzea sp. NBRC 105346]|uniref:hypothetical protein n=1 Tax=Lentzea sp. NBRC 105346 TaxID=3032205 RepID=UPI0024A466F0|nr:hypothetical protein [Lentzea sp. NBRC 105346]GLZ33285.1 hypothetical protein Lesp02_54730 [Lentzea sp. NBRC 105346]
MDEHKLAELFRDAVRDAPPASFDEGDVRSASRRLTTRRRTQFAVGTTMVVVLGLGGTVLATSLIPKGDSANTSAAQGEATAMKAPADPRDGSFGMQSVPSGGSTQGDSSPGTVGPETEADTKSAPQGCGAVDRKLADALAAELSVPTGQEAVPVDIGCPEGSRAATFVVEGQRVSAIVTPPGAAMQFLANTKFTQVQTASKQTLHVFVEPADGPAADRVQQIASDLQGQF